MEKKEYKMIEESVNRNYTNPYTGVKNPDDPMIDWDYEEPKKFRGLNYGLRKSNMRPRVQPRLVSNKAEIRF